jgi:acetolactate decarboxylase
MPAVRMLMPLLLVGCATATPPLQTFGTLRGVMLEGETGPVVAVESTARRGNYAVGALAGLEGEVTILDGEVYRSTPAGDERGAGNAQATLLAVAHPARMIEVTVGETIPAAGLDDGLAALAVKAGLGTKEPFVVVVRGSFQGVRWHIVGGAAPGASHEEHQQGGRQGADSEREGVLVGLYSEGHAGVFTHMGQRSHLHLISEGMTAHVDAVAIPAGTKVSLGR